jgi:NAD+ diphosphatase
METGEQAEETLRRELREEIALEIDQVKLITVRAFQRPGQVEIIFRCQAIGDPDRLSFEIQKAGWFSLAELPPELPSDQVQLIRRALSDGATPHD